MKHFIDQIVNRDGMAGAKLFDPPIKF